MLHPLVRQIGLGFAVTVVTVPSPGIALVTRAVSHAAAVTDRESSASLLPRRKRPATPRRDDWQKPDDVVSLLQLWPGNVVGDIGAGTGYFESHLAKAVGPTGRVVALDAEPRAVAALKRRVKRERLKNVTVQTAAADDPGLAEGSVDRLLVVDAWRQLSPRLRYVAALNRALRPGGFVVVVDFTAESIEGPPVQARVPPATVVADLRAAGFSARAVAESLPLQYVVIGQKPGPSMGRPATTVRQRELIDIINANAESARFTRGVNARTVQTLTAALQPTDDPELRALLYRDENVVIRTAGSVFSARGDRGLAVLREVSADPALPENNRSVVDDVIWTANARPKPL